MKVRQSFWASSMVPGEAEAGTIYWQIREATSHPYHYTASQVEDKGGLICAWALAVRRMKRETLSCRFFSLRSRSKSHIGPYMGLLMCSLSPIQTKEWWLIKPPPYHHHQMLLSWWGDNWIKTMLSVHSPSTAPWFSSSLSDDQAVMFKGILWVLHIWWQNPASLSQARAVSCPALRFWGTLCVVMESDWLPGPGSYLRLDELKWHELLPGICVWSVRVPPISFRKEILWIGEMFSGRTILSTDPANCHTLTCVTCRWAITGFRAAGWGLLLPCPFCISCNPTAATKQLG